MAELRASRERIVLAADDDRRRIERDLHEGVQQHLVALAVNLQLVGPLMDADAEAAKALVDEMGRDVQQTLDETAHLAQRIYPPLLEAAGLAAALRAAAVTAGVPASVDVVAGDNFGTEVARMVYACCVEALEHLGAEARTRIIVRVQDQALAFDIFGDGTPAGAARWNEGLDRQRDRVAALGGRLTVRSEPGGGTHVFGSFPLER